MEDEDYINPFFELRLKMSQYNVADMADNLYHYTGENGIQGIICSSGIRIRLTKSTVLNDMSEGNELMPLYLNECKSMAEKRQIPQNFAKIAINAKPSEKIVHIYYSGRDKESTPIYRHTVSEYETFIFSMSKEADSFPMWNYYSKGESGFNIGFNFGAFYASLTEYAIDSGNHVSTNELFFYQAIYDEKTKREYIRNMLYKSLSAYRKDNSTDRDYHLLTYLNDNLRCSLFLFKNPSFSYEKEYRLIYFRPLINDEKIILPKVEENNGKPYITLTIPYGSDYLSCVTKSPIVCESKFSIEDYLIKNKIVCNINKSKIPYRN